MANKGFSVNF